MQAQSRPPSVAYGECWCGCGRKTRIATATNRRNGHVKGEPVRYVKGHNERRSPRLVDHVARFWSHVVKGETCWEWQGSTRGHMQYGSFRLGSRTYSAHRASWELTHGPIPEGLSVLHDCDNPRCVRPDHLYLGTHAQNMADKVSRRRVAGERHPTAKLTDQQAEEIKALFAVGSLTKKAIAARYGITPTHVRSIVQGRRKSAVESAAERVELPTH